MPSMGLTEWAYSLSESMLAEPLPRRWAHSLGVAKRARSLSPILGRDADLLEAAAVLHDVGYSPPSPPPASTRSTGPGSSATRKVPMTGSFGSWRTTLALSWKPRSAGSGMTWRPSSSWRGRTWWMR